MVNSPFLVNAWLARKWDNVQDRDSRSYKSKITNKSRVLGVESWGRSSPRVKVPNSYVVRHDH